ncbi:MAG TPA: L,D-transpeptidase [Candidatus Angelobacter sp.]
MRRLVVISSKKSKAISVLIIGAFGLTSIHLAAAARVASLKRQQDQLEQKVFSTRLSVLPSNSLSAIQTTIQSAGNQSDIPQFSGAALDSKNGAASKASDPLTNATSAVHTRQIVISIPDRQLAVMENGEVLKIYPIAVGAKGSPSPDGDFVIINRAKDPTYRHAEMEIPPGKDNPLGSRWLGLSLKGYGIHGTNVQSSVGKAVSHGCFRMRKRDVEELYTLMQVGDKVTVRRERGAMIAQVFAVSNAPATQAKVVEAKASLNGDVQVASVTGAVTSAIETAQQ